MRLHPGNAGLAKPGFAGWNAGKYILSRKRTDIDALANYAKQRTRKWAIERGLMPWFVRPLVNPFFARHHL